MTRIPAAPRLVVGNWKMNLPGQAASDLARAVAQGHTCPSAVKVLLAPPYTVMERVSRCLASSPVELAAQDIHWESGGPFTGAISAEMVRAAGATHVLVGHSERRQLFGEDDEAVRLKINAAWAGGLTPILCVGENEQQREAGKAAEIVTAQLNEALGAHSKRPHLIIAYEPIWAIGTGRVASPAQAGKIHRVIKKAAPQGTMVLYGGSVVPENADALLDEKGIDGLLVGTASLDPDAFLAIIRMAAHPAPS